MSLPGARETRAFASELKFLIPRATGAAVRDWARRHLGADPHGSGEFRDEYNTTTLYFDTPEFDVFHRRASFGRSKFRVRRYGDNTEVFVERKLRRPGMLTKRRVPVPMAELVRLETDDWRGWDGSWFHRRLLLRRLKPVCEISYHRVARAALASTGPIRLTLDDRLRVCRTGRCAFGDDTVGVRFLEQHMILELKFRSEVPALFRQLVEEFKLEPQVASKYRLGMAAIAPELVSPEPVAVEARLPVAGSGPPCA